MKKFSVIFFVCLVFVVLIACRQKKDYSKYKTATPPDMTYIQGDYELDFDEMNEYVIEYLQSYNMPFFFVKNNPDGILKGDNRDKTITLFCNCINGTTVNDLDLFISMSLIGMSYNASEQDLRFKQPNSDDGHYIDFGSVFDVYNLKIDAKDENGNILRNDFVKAKNKMPDGIRPEYINID